MDEATPALLAVWGTILVGGSAGLAMVGRRLTQGRELAPLEPRTPVPWRLPGVLLALVLLFLLRLGTTMATASAVIPPDVRGDMDRWPPASKLYVMLADSLGSLAAVAVATLALRVACSATWRDLGFSGAHPRRDFAFGVVGFLAVLLPIYALQLALTFWLEPTSIHPLIEVFRQLPEPGVLLIAALMAVVAAPISEEFFFRGVLQGWLESEFAETGVPWWPILVSSAVFALLHLQHGYDAVPLFFLGLALGYLYRQTHRLWPSIVLHACLNACSLLLLWLTPA